VNLDQTLEILEDTFGKVYEAEYTKLMFQRMGLFVSDEKDMLLLKLMLKSLEDAVCDYNLFFRKLSSYKGNRSEILDMAVYRDSLERWLESYELRLQKESLTNEERKAKMLRVNPKYVLKNHILQAAIQKADENDFTMLQDLLKVALAPFDEHKELEYLSKPTPSHAKNIKLSCSS
jgi:uncharacterized protein YdiU (UPF0061 family)